MAQESNAIKNGNFHAAGLVVFGAGIFTNLVRRRLGDDENVILDVLALRRDFLERPVNVNRLNGTIY